MKDYLAACSANNYHEHRIMDVRINIIHACDQGDVNGTCAWPNNVEKA